MKSNDKTVFNGDRMPIEDQLSDDDGFFAGCKGRIFTCCCTGKTTDGDGGAATRANVNDVQFLLYIQK